jgi:hypothetical protein
METGSSGCYAHSNPHDILSMLLQCGYFFFGQIWIKFGAGNVHKIFRMTVEFHANGRTESCTLFGGINEFLSVLSIYITHFW